MDVLISAGMGAEVIGFYDDAHAVLADDIRGYPVLGDVGMLKSMLSVEPVRVIVAITANKDRLKIANAVRGLGGQFANAIHPTAYVSEEAVLGDGTVVTATAVVQPDATVGSHCCLGPGVVVERDAVVGAGSWISAGAVVGPGARVGARAVVGHNAAVGRKAAVGADVEVGALWAVPAEGRV